ncbi:MAG TPA: hypothetical protein V6C58_01840 [Allocoleopsis sp.]
MNIKDFVNKSIIVKFDRYETLISPGQYYVQKIDRLLEITLTFPVFFTEIEDDELNMIDLVAFKISVKTNGKVTVVGESFWARECPYDSASVWSERTLKRDQTIEVSWSEIDCEIELI